MPAALEPGPVEVPLDAEHQRIDLPIDADLPAADEAGLVESVVPTGEGIAPRRMRKTRAEIAADIEAGPTVDRWRIGGRRNWRRRAGLAPNKRNQLCRRRAQRRRQTHTNSCKISSLVPDTCLRHLFRTLPLAPKQCGRTQSRAHTRRSAHKTKRTQDEALGQSVMERWPENGSYAAARGFLRKVPGDEFSPSTIRNRCRFPSSFCRVREISARRSRRYKCPVQSRPRACRGRDRAPAA